MWIFTTSLKLYISVVMFYSTFCGSKCRNDGIPDIARNEEDGSPRLYRTEIPDTPPYVSDGNTFAFMAWIAILSVVVCVVVIVCICCLCWKFYPKHLSRRQSSGTVLVQPQPATVVTFQAGANQSIDMGLSNATAGAGNLYSRGVVNFSFTNSPQGVTSGLPPDEGPPPYTEAISQTFPDAKLTYIHNPHFGETKTVETPPPAYITVAPFH